MELLALPSKQVGLFSPAGVSNLIARSDSNGEDLEAFAGAGACLDEVYMFTSIIFLTLAANTQACMTASRCGPWKHARWTPPLSRYSGTAASAPSCWAAWPALLDQLRRLLRARPRTSRVCGGMANSRSSSPGRRFWTNEPNVVAATATGYVQLLGQRGNQSLNTASTYKFVINSYIKFLLEM